MSLRFGLFVNTDRPGLSTRDAIAEDIYEIVTADRLGFHEAWVSEHYWPAELVISQAIHLTSRIRLGSGVRPIAFYHPLQVALEANVSDQISNGRYMLGVGVGGPGGGREKMKQWGLGEDALRRPRMLEAIDFILKALTAKEPFDYDGNFWTGRNITLPVTSVQTPHVPIAVANATSMGTSEMAGKLGFLSLRSQFDEVDHMRALTQAYADGTRAAGRTPQLGNIRAARFVWVSESTSQAKEELRDAITPAIEKRKQYAPHSFDRIARRGRTGMDVTWDDIVDSGYYFVGDPDRVAELVKLHFEDSGGYGVLLLVGGKNFGTREQRARSMDLFMTAAAPKLDRLVPSDM